MLSNSIYTVFALSLSVLSPVACAAEVHGAGAEGTVMGPVAFLWPADRPWSADADNIAPCGSSAGVTNRTTFPLVLGAVSLSIADEAYNVAIRIAYGNNPTTQAEFAAIKGNTTELEPGHQCYSFPTIPSNIIAGSNATIQLEYWASDSGKNESFFACADVTFVEASAFTISIPCFNVTSSEFVPTGTTDSTTSTPAVTATAIVSTGLATGQIAGISVGTVLGAILIAGAALFVVLRKRRAAAAARNFDSENQPPSKQMAETSSLASAETATARY